MGPPRLCRTLRKSVALVLASTGPLVAQGLIRVGEPIEIRPAWTDGNWVPGPQVGLNPVDGSFMTVWPEASLYPLGTIQARRFGPSGQPLDPAPVQVNTVTAGFEGYQSVAANERGEFLVVWAGRPIESEFFFDIFGANTDSRRRSMRSSSDNSL